jgi:hypothetical protein
MDPQNSPAGKLDELDLAKQALERLSTIAVDLGASQKLYHAGVLGAKLFLTKGAVDVADQHQLSKPLRRIPKLLRDLEMVCSVCRADKGLLSKIPNTLQGPIRSTLS